MRSFKVLAAAALLAVSCAPKAGIELKLTDAPSHEVEVRMLDVNTWKILDTVKTGSDGRLRYSVKVEKGKPEFVYLYSGTTRLASLLLHSGDRVIVTADTLGSYSVEGSEDCTLLGEREASFAAFASEMAVLDARGGRNAEMAKLFVKHYREDVSFSMFSVVHEGGHALYDTGSRDEFAFTVLDGGVSMCVHESQSRFYENYLGRSRAFCEYLFPILREIFPEHLQNGTAEEFYRAINRVEPTLIRTQADELTYCLHVLVRYELEKAVMDGALSVDDMPGEWNRLYKEYLGIDVPDDRRGILQDSHWADGYLGYFPSYALGNAYGAQFLRKMRETVDVDDCLRRGDLGPINDWNRQHIWQYGCLYRPADLFRRATGEDFDPTVYTDYLEEKYTALYGLTPRR